MRISVIFVIWTLCVVVRGWVALLQPIALSIGAAFVALNFDADLASDLQPTALMNLFSKVKITEEEKGTSTVSKFRPKKWAEMITNPEYRESLLKVLGPDKTIEEHVKDLENMDSTAYRKIEKW